MVFALGCSALMLVAPGLPVALWVRRRTEIDWRIIATSVPAASITITFIVVRLWPGDRIETSGALAYLAIAIAASVIGLWFARGDGLRLRSVPLEDRARLAVHLGALLAAVAISAFAWSSGMGALSAPTPHNDGANHDFMATRIVEAGTNEGNRVILGGPEGLSTTSNYYPLGLHSTVAVVAAASDATTPEGMNSVLLLAMAMIFPFGVYAFTRLLVPEFPYAAPAAAVVSVGVSALPYDAISWGAVTTAVGLSLVLPIAALIISTVRSASKSWPAAVLLGLSAVGLFHIHNTQLLAALVIVGIVLVFDRNPDSDRADRPRAARSLAADVGQAGLRGGGVAVVLAAPLIPQVLSGASERESALVVSGIDPFRILGQAAFMSLDGFATERHGWVLVLSILGLAVCIRRGRYALPILLVGAVAAATWSIYGNSYLRFLTYPWYRNSERLTYNVALLAFVATGVLVGAVIHHSTRGIDRWKSSRRLLERRGPAAATTETRPEGARSTVATTGVSPARGLEVGVAGVILLVLLFGLVIPGARQGKRVVADSFRQFSVSVQDSQSAFHAVARIAGKRGTVIAAPAADGLWGYALTGTEPLFAIYLGDVEGGRDRSFWERVEIQEHLDRLGRDPDYDTLIAKYRVRAVYLRTNSFPLEQNYRKELVLEDLQSNDGLRLAFHEGDHWVFEVVATSART